eukprot:435645_1
MCLDKFRYRIAKSKSKWIVRTFIFIKDNKNTFQNINTIFILLSLVVFISLFISNPIIRINSAKQPLVTKSTQYLILDNNINITNECRNSIYKIQWNVCCYRQFSYHHLYAYGFKHIKTFPYFYSSSDTSKSTIFISNGTYNNNNIGCYGLYIHQSSYLYNKNVAILLKTKLYSTVMTYCHHNNISKECKLWLPKTYNFANKIEKINFFKQLPCDYKQNKDWILKRDQHGGSGIQLINDSNYFRKIYLTEKEQKLSNPNCMVQVNSSIKSNMTDVVAQQFVSNLLRINNHKFHIRSFFILANYQNPYLVLYADSIIIKATKVESIITNRAISKYNYEQIKTHNDDWIWNMTQFDSYLKTNSYDINVKKLINTIKNTAKIMFLSAKLNTETLVTLQARQIRKNEQHYALTALDLLITNDKIPQIKIMELNGRPRSSFIPEICDNILETNWQCKMGKMIQEEMIDIQIEIAIKKIIGEKIDKINSLKHLQPIIWD